MKKFMIFVMFLFLFFNIQYSSNAASWSYKWENTEVKIPVGDSINKYSDIPKAYLYKDGILLDDANISIITEGDWLYYLSDVNTKKIGTYEVWYKAFENEKYRPGTCHGYKCKISFVVYDDIAPQISLYKEEVKIRLNSKYDPLSNVRVSDNCDLELEVGYTGDFDVTKNGTYTVNVYAIDSSNNKTEISYDIIVESSPPVIKYNNKEINIGINDTLDIKAYFEGYDEILGDVTSFIEYGEYDSEKDILNPLDTSKIGKKELTLRLCIHEHVVMKNVLVNIVDDEPPVMSFSEKDLNEGITLNYNYGYETYDFLKHVNITDNVEIDYDNLTFKTNCEKKVGSYTVWYYYNDTKFNISGSLVVNLISYDPPKIEVTDIETYIDEELDYYDYINVIDESDPNILSKVKVDDSLVDLSTPGIYYAEVYAINSSGRSTTEKIKVKVLEKSSSKDNTIADSESSSSSSSGNSDESNKSSFINNDSIESLKSDSKSLIIIGLLVLLVIYFLRKSKKNN